MYLLATVF
jgi:hypothetical protein